MKVLIFAGAGASVELGVPAMRQMAIDLVEHLNAVSVNSTFVSSLKQRIEDGDADLELVIEDIDKVCDADVLATYGGTVDSELIESARLTRSEIEWFVQHNCERVLADAATALWSPILRDVTDVEFILATTNYDRAIELASLRHGIELSDGFDAFGPSEWASWTGFGQGGLKLLKLHGSTDWYQVAGRPEVVKLRHPMPLFGGVTLHLDSASLGALGSALVLPSREKRKNAPPFPSISYELIAASKSVDLAVFVGTSLRDPDMQDLARDCARRMPIIVVGPNMTFDDGEVIPAEAAIVQNYASEFLISSLPQILTTSEIPESGSITPSRNPQGSRSILSQVIALADVTAAADIKCSAIEELWNSGVSLGSRELRPLFESASGRVARDALGLIPLSRDVAALKDECAELSKRSQDEAFKADAELLASTLGPE